MKTPVFMFPRAPKGWNSSIAEIIAAADGLVLIKDHWILMQCLQEYYSRNEFPRLRGVTDALDEKFHDKGGMKYLHQILPKGPISQGCKLAGLQVPAGCIDVSFGTAA